MHQASILFVIASFISTVAAHNDYDEVGWKEASKFISEHLNRTKNPCDEFYDHVCGNYGTKDGEKFEHNWSDHMQILQNVVLEAIKSVDMKNSTPISERSVRIFFDQCMSSPDDVDHKKKLNDAITSKIGKSNSLGEANAFEILTGDAKFNPWRFLARVKRDTGVDCGIGIITNTFKLKKGSSFALLPDGELSNGTIDTELEKECRQVPFSQLSAIIPNIDWDSYFDELLPSGVKEVFVSNRSNIVVDVYYAGMLDDIGRVINAMNSSVIRARAFGDTAQMIVTELDGFPFLPITEKERCVSLAVSSFCVLSKNCLSFVQQFEMFFSTK